MKESKIVKIEDGNRVVFVGDTHGDVEASKKVIENFLDDKTKIVFLGDYVDRGEFSKENIDYLLEMKEKHPNDIFLLMGNHEGYEVIKLFPNNFWASLSNKEYKYYSSLLMKLPLVAITKNKIIALHGALPKVNRISEIEKIVVGDDNWKAITWGDFEFGDEEKDIVLCSGRPKYSKEYFESIMKNLGMKLLIRAHQPTAPLIAYENRCITIFTSKYYPIPRRIAIVNLKREIKDAKDVKIMEI
ncbi:MAG: metallophosphoesterase family protein [Candidatus Pacearchaeota archaeon]